MALPFFYLPTTNDANDGNTAAHIPYTWVDDLLAYLREKIDKIFTLRKMLMNYPPPGG